MSSAAIYHLHKGSWLERRPVLSLWIMSLLLLLGAMAHSESARENALKTAKTWIQAFTRAASSTVGLTAKEPETVPASVSPLPKLPVIHNSPSEPAAAAKPAANNAIYLHPEPVHRYVYQFEGKAAFHGAPCAQARVVVKLTYGDSFKTQETLTNADGSYTISIPIEASPNTAVDWTMEAFSADYDRLEMVGRRITTREQDLVTVQTPVEFLAQLTN